MGFKFARVISLEQYPISENYALVKIHWRVVFTGNGERIVEFDVSYIVHQGSIEPKVVMFITHQDESQFMQRLGSREV